MVKVIQLKKSRVTPHEFIKTVYGYKFGAHEFKFRKFLQFPNASFV